MDKVCVITDNRHIYRKFIEIISERKNYGREFFFYCSEEKGLDDGTESIDLQKCNDSFFDRYGLYLSLHCKQIFPRTLIKNHRCINVHPGLNPYNRGVYPHVFSIINGLPAGVTIHEMDERLDHGGIIFQKPVVIHSWDTSKDVYERIIDTEAEILKEHLQELITGDYSIQIPNDDGNINYKKDFNKLCLLDLDSEGTLREHMNLLRALSHDGYKNAYYIEDGRKIFVDVRFEKDRGGVSQRTERNPHKDHYLGIKMYENAAVWPRRRMEVTA